MLEGRSNTCPVTLGELVPFRHDGQPQFWPSSASIAAKNNAVAYLTFLSLHLLTAALPGYLLNTRLILQSTSSDELFTKSCRPNLFILPTWNCTAKQSQSSPSTTRSRSLTNRSSFSRLLHHLHPSISFSNIAHPCFVSEDGLNRHQSFGFRAAGDHTPCTSRL